jgi:Protein of unknown function (DUF2442)
MRNSLPQGKKSNRSNRYVEVVDVEVIGDFRLKLRLTDGSTVERDLSRFVERYGVGLRSKLRDQKFFRRARPGLGTVVWSRDIDISPHMLIWQTFPTPAKGKPKKFAIV